VGPASTVAGDLVYTLEQYGYLPDMPAYHALGALFIYLMDDPTLPIDHMQILARLIVRYSLVRDIGYLKQLRAKLHLSGATLQEVIGTTATQDNLSNVAEPLFDAMLPDESGLEPSISSSSWLAVTLTIWPYCLSVSTKTLASGRPAGVRS
jgi:hypothetical protein